jgi:hypothetical protein
MNQATTILTCSARYTTDPALAWPIIDSLGIECGRCWNEGRMRTNPYDAAFARIPFIDGKFVGLGEYGATPLIAAMRVYLTSVMGDTRGSPRRTHQPRRKIL